MSPSRHDKSIRPSRPFHPSPAVLAICQDRLREKDFLRRIGAPTTAWVAVHGAAALADGVAALGGAAVLKTARFGYDGKGQMRLGPGADPQRAWASFGAPAGILEALVDFALEISVITARAADGACASFVPVENRHREHILARTVAPAPGRRSAATRRRQRRCRRAT